MTTMGLDYLKYQETKRSNLAQETETNRSNVVREGEINRSNLAKEGENNRHNVVTEVETNRHNIAGEVETNRSNLAREAENNRSNVARENENYRSNVARETENYRSNVARETENHRSNVQNEAINRERIAESGREADQSNVTNRAAAMIKYLPGMAQKAVATAYLKGDPTVKASIDKAAASTKSVKEAVQGAFEKASNVDDWLKWTDDITSGNPNRVRYAWDALTSGHDPLNRFRKSTGSSRGF